MKLNVHFFTTPAGHIVLAAVVAATGGTAILWQRQHRQPPALPLAAPAIAVALPQTFNRDGARFKLPTVAAVDDSPAPAIATRPNAAIPPVPKPPPVLPLSLFNAAPKTETPNAEAPARAPFGRLIPCETVITIESNHLETPLIGLVREDVWHDGKLVVPAGAEVHGRVSLDRNRERLAAEGAWHLVWRTNDAANGSELTVQGLALDRDFDPATGTVGLHDGSAGLRGEVIRTDNAAEIKLFTSTFLSTATAALEDTNASAGVLGTVNVPAATARNAALAGTGAILRDYAQRIRDAIQRDGFYVRVPAGKAFYLYVTEKLGRGEAPPTSLHA